MNKTINFLKPAIFPEDKIICGITQTNRDNFPPYGFSITPAEIYTTDEITAMRMALSNQLGINPVDFVMQKQVHSDIISIVDDNYSYRESDALITNLKGKILNVSIADCAGILIYDKYNETVAAVHSGWRGSVQNILTKTVQTMISQFSADIQNTLFYVSPLASVVNYEVGNDIADLMPEFCKLNNGKYYFDNRAKLLSELQKLNIPEENIEISNICTMSDNNFHSFRRDKSKSGRMSCFIGMK